MYGDIKYKSVIFSSRSPKDVESGINNFFIEASTTGIEIVSVTQSECSDGNGKLNITVMIIFKEE